VIARVLVPVLALLLAACSGSPPDEGPPPDRRLEQTNLAGTHALALNQTAEAIKQYRAALTLAYERDDAAAIGDVGYNLAVAQLRAGSAADAARTVREIRAELDRRRKPPPAELILVQAAAAYRLGAADDALTAAQEVLARSPLDRETASRAWYIRGAVLADRGDAQGLALALAAIPPSAQPDQEGDRLELSGRAALLAGASDRAARELEQAADQRRLALDYRGMARALALAGEATLRQGRTGEAAVLYLRAGRSALLQGDAATGRTLLDRADQLARESGAVDVRAEIDRVKKSAAAAPKS
jgi:tetratricopeptide (TPR) repeat protein